MAAGVDNKLLGLEPEHSLYKYTSQPFHYSITRMQLPFNMKETPRDTDRLEPGNFLC